MGYLATKFCLRKPVTAFLIMLSVVFFGFISITTFKYELMPKIEMPMYAVLTVYPGAQPEDIDNLITRKFEDKFYNLQGMKNIQGTSRANMSIMAIQYNYGQNMDKAYTELKKVVDQVRAQFKNDKIQEPTIFEMDVSAVPVMKLAVSTKDGSDVYNYVKNTMVKEIEKISEASQVDTSGGKENYVKIEVKPDMMERHNLSIDTLKSVIANADFAFPGGSLKVGDRELSFTTNVEYKTVDSFKSIPIITGNKRTLYLEDVADIYIAQKKTTQLGRYDEKDCVVVSITKTQSASTIDLSRKVISLVDRLQKENNNLVVTVVEDNADDINNSIHNVFETMIIAIILSMLVIWIFLGDFKASFIIGTSIPFSVLTSFVCMNICGYTLNIITLSALVLGVGMMVDNSIVVLEACFRGSDEYPNDDSRDAYCKAALISAKTIGASVFGSTLTTVVVFAPLGFLSGMAGQFFKPLGFTIVFCMLASYISAITVVPLFYVLIKPKENSETFAIHFVESLQDMYRRFLPKLLNHKWITFVISLLLLIASFALIKTFETELVAEADNRMISIGIQTKPGLSLDARNKIYKQIEDFVMSKNEVTHYVLSNSASSMSMSGGGGQSLIAYLVDEKESKDTTKQIVSRWKHELANVTDCTLNISSYSTSGTGSFVMPSKDKVEIIIEGSDYTRIKDANDRIVKKLEQRKDCGDITSTLDNAAPLIKAEIDPILAAAEGYSPAAIGGVLNNMLSGVEVMDKTIDGETIKVNIEYAEQEFDTIEKVANIRLEGSNGDTMLKDIAKISYHDNPSGIPKYNKKYRCTITTYLNEFASENSKDEIQKEILNPIYNKYVERGRSVVDEMRNEEFSQLFIAIAAAAFLVFVVMASQFESVKFSFMVMGTVFFSIGGALFGLWIANLKLSMVALLGFLMLIGTAVNNGILYVDTVNQFINDGKELKEALVESGAIRLRPILMTTLTTIVSMIPMSLAYGNNGEILQGLAVANIGGLVSSTIMALFILPVHYLIFSVKKVEDANKLMYVARDAITYIEDVDREKAIENAQRRKDERNKIKNQDR